MVRRQSSEASLNPFVPGLGVVPPFLAGRRFEQRQIRDSLIRLEGSAAPGTFAVLQGPTGNGQMALLVCAKREAESRRIPVIDVSLGESETPETETGEPRRLAQWLRAVSGFSVLGTGVNWREVPPSKLVTAIDRRVRKRPAL